MAATLKIETNKVRNSYDTVKSIESYVSTHNFHNYFFDMEDYIDEINLKHGKCINGYKDRIYEITESIDKIKNKVNLLSDSLRKTLDMQTKLEEPSIPVSSNVQLRNTLEQAPNSDSSQVIIPVPKPAPEQMQKDGLFPEGYDTTPIGLGIAAAGVTASIGAVVIDSMMPKSAKRKTEEYKVDDDDINDYRDYEIADEAEEKPEVSLKIDPSLTSYQASRNHDSMKKFYDE